jgi:hypothetical protein
MLQSDIHRTSAQKECSPPTSSTSKDMKLSANFLCSEPQKKKEKKRKKVNEKPSFEGSDWGGTRN